MPPLATEDLIEYGSLKPENEQGYDEEQLEQLTKSNEAPAKQEIVKDGVKILLNPDPTGRRTGEGVLRKQVLMWGVIFTRNLLQRQTARWPKWSVRL